MGPRKLGELRDGNLSRAAGTGYRTFLIMPYAEKQTYKILECTIRDVLKRYGIAAVRADDRQTAPTLWQSMQNHMDGCSHAISIIDNQVQTGINGNVLIEMGYMLARNAGVLLLKDLTLDHLPTDLLGHLYRTFDPSNIEATTEKSVIGWLRDEGLAKRPSEKLVVFVSHGGTCRCAMSKAILLNTLKARALPFDLKIMSLAAIYGERRGASPSARAIVKSAFGEDVLRDHQVRKHYPALDDEADLILCADAKLKRHFPEAKTKTIGEYFGKGEDIRNPWPSEGSGSAQRYKKTFQQLKILIEGQSEKLLSDLKIRG